MNPTTTPSRRGRPSLNGARAAGLALAIAIATLAAPAAMAANGDCAQPVSSGSGPNTSDCSFVLRAAVGTNDCELCVCDVNGSGDQTTTDALVCLKAAVGQNVNLSCPSCDGVTTTTISGASTTSTSTTSTTTTIPVFCNNNGDCDALPAEFRCNPNTDTCETPCTKNSHCKDFYLCNTTTQYCEEPAFLF